jgi:hypothetical protein
MQHRTVLEYRNYRYLKIAGFIVVASIVAYLYQTTPVGRYGGTPVGYALGTIAAAFILWLMWFGVRKRQYSASLTSTQGWLSAHIYFGAALIIVASLHAGFQFGWNVHTLAYALLLFVVGSGFFGVYAYLRFPTQLTENIGQDTRDSLLLRVADIDRDLQKFAIVMPDNLAKSIDDSVHHTVIGGGVYSQLRQTHPRCATLRTIKLIEAVTNDLALQGEQAQTLHKIYDAILRKQKIVARIRRDIRLKAIMQIWLYLHVPLSFGLLAALVAHIVAVFFYW